MNIDGSPHSEEEALMIEENNALYETIESLEDGIAVLMCALNVIADLCDYNEASDHCSDHHAKVDSIVSDVINTAKAAIKHGDDLI